MVLLQFCVIVQDSNLPTVSTLLGLPRKWQGHIKHIIWWKWLVFGSHQHTLYTAASHCSSWRSVRSKFPTVQGCGRRDYNKGWWYHHLPYWWLSRSLQRGTYGSCILKTKGNYSGAQMKCNWENLRYHNNWCCNLNESKCSPKVLSEVVFMRWFTGYKVCMVLSWGVYLWICQFWTFSIIFFMEFEVDHLKEPFFLSRIAFFLIKNNPLLVSNMGVKRAIFNKNDIKHAKWPLLTAYNSWIWPHFLIKQNAIILRKKGSFRWSTSNSMKKFIEKVQNWQIQR